MMRKEVAVAYYSHHDTAHCQTFVKVSSNLFYNSVMILLSRSVRPFLLCTSNVFVTFRPRPSAVGITDPFVVATLSFLPPFLPVSVTFCSLVVSWQL